MANPVSAVWYYRADGVNAGSWGFDPENPNAGTNYGKEPSVHFEISDAATASAGSTTLTSATGGFTPSMVGNSFGLYSGTNSIGGHHFIESYVDTNTITVGEPLDNGNGGLSGGNIRIGGAKSSLSFGVGVAGNTYMIRGSGDDDPTTVDYSVGNYLSVSAGTTAGGYRRYIGYNGRPHIRSSTSLVIHSATRVILENLKLSPGGTQYSPSYAIANFNEGTIARNIIIDQNGIDCRGTRGGMLVEGCWFKNSGDATPGTVPAISKSSGNYSSCHRNNFVDGWKGPGIHYDAISGVDEGNIIRNCASDGIVFDYNTVNRPGPFIYNTVVGNAGAGIRFKNVPDGNYRNVYGNIIANNTGAGLVCDSNTTTTNNYHGIAINRNAFYSNAGGDYSNISPGTDDVLLTTSPFRNYAAGDYRLNRSAIAGGLLTSIPSTYLGNAYAKSFRDIGALQHDIAEVGDSAFYYLQTFENRPAAPSTMGEDATSLNDLTPLVSTVGNSWTTYAGAYSTQDHPHRIRLKAADATVYGTGSYKLNLQGFDPGLNDFRVTAICHAATAYRAGLVFRHDPAAYTFYMLYVASSNLYLYYFNGSSFDSPINIGTTNNSGRGYTKASAEVVGNTFKAYDDTSALVYTGTLSNNAGKTGQGLVGTSGKDSIAMYYAIHEVGTDFNSIYPLQAVGRQPAIPHPLYLS